MKKGERIQFCPQGHDTFVVGREPAGCCRECKKEYRKRRQKLIKENLVLVISKKQFCQQDHDTFICGRNKYGCCNECARINARDYNREHKEKRKKYMEKYRKEHKEELSEWAKEYREAHKEEIAIRMNNYILSRLDNDINFKLAFMLRMRIREAIKKDWKTGSAVKDLGCTIDFLKDYISAKFYDGMTWNNWGVVWELDHIKALMFFDLTDRKQFLKAINYKNLQPLTIEEHRKKTNKELSKLAKLKAKQK